MALKNILKANVEKIKSTSRPFQLSISDLVDKNLNCLGGRPLIQEHLEYAFDFIEAYKTRGFFSLMFLNSYSHDSNHRLKWVDEYLFKFLTKFSSSKASKSTVLILFSDHGPRFSQNRKTMRGLLKERNPFFSIYMPDEELRENIKINSKRLVTPMDVHKSLVELIYRQKG